MSGDENKFPCAVVEYDTENAVEWALQHMQDDDTLTVWTSFKSTLGVSSHLAELVRDYENVEHIFRRGGAFVREPGPVIMLWPDMDDIAELLRFASHQIRALCVVSHDPDGIRPWVTVARPTILGDTRAWDEQTPTIDPVAVEALSALTLMLNHSNTIAGGPNKDRVVGTLLVLRKARIPMDGDAFQGWALAHGWTGGNPKRLAGYVDDIKSGKRPQTRSVIRDDYIDTLRRRAAGEDEEDD